MTIFDTIRYPIPNQNFYSYPHDIVSYWRDIQSRYNDSYINDEIMLREIRNYVLNRDIEDYEPI